MTPIVKTWPSEWAQIALHHGLQIHGGSGYTRDFEIELLYRDNRLNPIHEGTTGIQGIDLVGRKMRREQGESFALLAQRIRASIQAGRSIGRDPDGQVRLIAGLVEKSLDQIVAAVDCVLAERNNAKALAWGTPMLFAIGHFVIGWIWLEQATAVLRLEARGQTAEADFIASRIRCARFFAETELPKIDAWLGEIISNSDLVFSASLEEF